ncbi:MAG: C40 family peptidase [Nocardioidaceae bacterium]
MPALAAWRRTLVAVPVIIAALMCSLLYAPQAGALTLTEQKIAHALAIGINQKGDPYRYGAAGPNAFDCSGLTYFSYRSAGLYLPRTAQEQYNYVRHITKAQVRKGDLVFFKSGGYVYHVGVFLGWVDGHGYILHAPHTGTVVRRERIWTTAWYPGTVKR